MGYKLKKAIKLSEIAERLNCKWWGKNIEVESVTSFDNICSSDMTFTKSLTSSVTGAVVITKSIDIPFPDDMGVIVSDNPRLTFIKALDFLHRDIGFSTWQTPSIIDSSSILGDNVVIQNGCVVGENSVIEANVVLHSGTKIGKNCRIRANSCIGGDGFGFERLASGELLRFPHLGGVEIQDNVEIGSLNSIARGTLSDTVIGLGVKTDNLVHIAHNCIIGKNSIITACAELSGGVILGESVWVGPNASIIQKVSVGSNSLIGIGAVVTKNVPDNCVFAGHPAKKIRDNN